MGFFSAALVAFIFTLPLSLAAQAQENSLRGQLPRDSRAGLQVVAFENGLPATGLEIETQGLFKKTDGSGTVTFLVTPGQHSLNVRRLEKPITYTAIEGEQTQVIVNLISTDDALSETKNPEVAATLPEVKNAQGTPVDIKIVSADSGKPIAGASVMVTGFTGTLTSDASGNVKAQLPPGKHGLSVFHEKFQTQVQPAVQVGADSFSLNLKLKTAVDELEEFVVLAPKIQGSLAALVELRRTSSAVTDVLSAEQMARAGDSDAAASLRRVTGLTLIGGKYIYVRGLGERYSAVTLNGASIPSPEPSRRVVPLDLFPTAMLESVIVQKSATSNLPGEFGGGLIQLRSRGVPAAPFVRVSVSQSLDSANDSLTYAGGSTDWLGVDDGTRKLPQSIRNALQSGTPIKARGGLDVEGFSPEELAQMGREIKPIYNTRRQDLEPMPNLTLAAGRRWNLSSMKLGTSGSILRSSSFDHVDRKSVAVILRDGATVRDRSSTTDSSEQEYKLGSALDLSLDITKDQKIRANGLIVRHTSNEVEVSETFPEPGSGSANYERRETTTLEWTERQLFVRQLAGEHALPLGMQIDWRAQRAEATRNAPHTREYSFYDRFGYYEFDMNSTGNSMVWNELYDVSDEYGTQLNIPVKTFAGPVKLTLGANYLERNRESNTFRFVFLNRSSDPNFCDATDRNLERGCLNSRNIGVNGFVPINQTLAADSYTGVQTTRAQFLTASWEPGRQWEVQAGARAEQGQQEVKTYYYESPGQPSAFAGLRTDDVLPAYNLTWKPNDKWRARLAYSETLTRPEFREMAEVGFIDEETGIRGIGNSKLTGTVIQNYDHRWEYYPTPDESVSVGLFYKEFKNPIEDTFAIESDGVRKTFMNAKGASNRGIEIESRVAMRRVARALRRWTLSNNLTLIDSKIELGQESSLQKSERALQGQSPWVINVQLQYDRPLSGTAFAMVYNAVGPRITEVGTFGLPDVFEQPFHQVDLTAQQRIGKSLSAGLSARNLLDPEVESIQGEQTVRSYRRGRSLSVSLSAVF